MNNNDPKYLDQKVTELPRPRPTLEPSSETSSSARDAPAGPEDRTVNILLVDDRRANLTVLESILEDLGQNLVLAESGEDALKQILEREFAVILLDVKMPGMDGFETASLIRQRERSRHTPIIFLTAFDAAPAYLFKGYAVGAVDYLSKPLAPEILRSKVRVFVDLYLKSERLRRHEEQRRLSEQRQHDRALHDLQRQTQLLLDSTAEAIFGLDLRGRFTFSNSAARSLYGYSAQEILGKSLDLLIPPESPAESAWMLERLGRGESVRNHETLHARKDGTKISVSLGLSAIRDEEGRVIGASIVSWDISDRKRAEEAIRTLNVTLEARVAERTAQLEEANGELDAFAYTVSHDLRAPLRAMHGFSQALLEDYSVGLDPNGQEYAHRIMAATQRMDVLIQGLLSYSRLGRVELGLEPVDLGPLLDDVLQQMRVDLLERKASVTVDAPLPVVIGHRLTLTQIMINLVSNAVKFVAARDVPRVRISAESAGSRVRVWIEDNGIGIAPEHQERIFRVFERLNKAEAYPGTGIGLAIVRRAMERMRGRVGVESEAGRGSRFWIELPRIEDADESNRLHDDAGRGRPQ